MLRLAFDFIITWRETRTRPNAYERNTHEAECLREKHARGRMLTQRLGENTGGITQVTGVEFILFAPFITVVMLCFLLVRVSAILYSILKVKSLMIPF